MPEECKVSQRSIMKHESPLPFVSGISTSSVETSSSLDDAGFRLTFSVYHIGSSTGLYSAFRFLHQE